MHRSPIFNINVHLRIVSTLGILLGLVSTPAWASAPLFLPPVSYSTGGLEAGFVAVADVNGDGKPDLLVANTYFSNTIGVLLGNGDGTFQPAVTYGSGGGFPVSIVVMDVNGDGRLDLVVANQTPCYTCSGDGLIGVLLGNGDGTFGSAVTYDSGGGQGSGAIGGGPSPGQLAVADLNGDGKPDVVVANCVAAGQGTCGAGNGAVGVLLGNGDGTFGPVATYDSGGQGAVTVAIADVNEDGNPDVLVSNNQCILSSNCSLGLVGVLLGSGNGTLQSAATYTAGIWSLRQVAIADINGDGHSDVIVGGCGSGDCFAANGKVSVLIGNGNGTFHSPQTYSSGGKLVDGIAVADLNGDGRLDLAATNTIDSSVSVFLGNGDGSFEAPTTFASASIFPYSIAAADVNGDAKPDLLVTSLYGPVPPECFGGSCGVVSVLLNNSAFDATPPVITISATPNILWPPKGEMVRITISGTITDSGSGVDLSSPFYVVRDEYGVIQPTGPITLSGRGTYSFTTALQASRLGSDRDGRHYTISVSAKDKVGNIGSNTAVVNVPHDHRQ